MARRKSVAGAAVKAHREAQGLTQEQLARRARIPLRTLQRIEQGYSEGRIGNLRKLASALKLTLDGLLDPPEKAAV